MSTYASGRWRRIALASMLPAATAALLIGQASASPEAMLVKGTFEATVTSGPGCNSPIICVKGPLKGGIKGDLELTAHSAAPSGTAGLTLVNSTSVIHTKDGDLFLATSAVADLSPSGGEHSSVDLVTGGTKKWAGASGYLQARGVVEGTTDRGDYEGTIVLP
jgi:hypothetical protein